MVLRQGHLLDPMILGLDGQNCLLHVSPNKTQEEANTLENGFKFAVALASNLSWRNLIHRFALPGAAVLLLSRDPNEKDEAMGFVKKIIDCVLHLNSLCRRIQSKFLLELMDDLGWHREVLNIEIMAMVRQSNYDTSNRELLKLLARLKTGTSTTKELLESTFSHLTDVSARHNKNKKMGAHAKWLYATASPYGKLQGPQIKPSSTDWQKFSTMDADKVSFFNQVHNVLRTKLPEIQFGQDERFPRSAEEIQKMKIRGAGPRSHMRSAAALAFILTDFENNFTNAQHADLGWIVRQGRNPY